MKALRLLLKSEGLDTKTLRILFEQEGLTTLALTADGDEALDVWERLRTLVPKTGRWPVLLGRPGEEDLPTERTVPSIAAILAEAEKIDARALLDHWHAQRIKNTREEITRHEAEGYDEDAEHYRKLLQGEEEYRGIPRDRWPTDVRPSDAIGIASQLTHRVDANWDVHSRPVTLALLPIAHGWEAPAVMKFGGWNANPTPAEHVAIQHYWHDQYGAALVAITNDIIESMVAKPPRTRKAAMQLARDQYHYCEDNVEQGTRSLEALAAKLLSGEAWYFWWD